LSGTAVKRVQVHAATYTRLSGDLVRIKARAINALCKFSLDDDNCEVVLRGDPDKLPDAASIIEDFVAANYIEEVSVTTDDMSVLLAGGKTCKLADIEKKFEVKTSAHRDRSLVEVRGEQSKVQTAVKALNQFLFGGDGAIVHKIVLNGQLLAMVIGRGGKNKIELQKKFPNVSITVNNSNSTLTLRGPEEEAEECRVDVLKLIAGAQVTETIIISSKLHDRFAKKTKPRDLVRDIPVQITLLDDSLKVRGYAPDVRDAVAILNDAIHGKYEARLALTTPQFDQILSSCRHQSSPLQRVKDASGASVVIDPSDQSVVFLGKRSQVKTAKIELFKFLDFLFGSSFARLELAGPLLSYVGRMATLSEFSAISGVSVHLDRDTGFVLLHSTEAGKLERAVEGLKKKIGEAGCLFFELKFEASEDWIVSSIIGSKGDQISKLRKTTKCEIEVDSASRSVLVKSTNAELTEKARATMDDLVGRLRRENSVVAMSEIDLPVFIGRAGATIIEFSDRYEVDAKVQKHSAPPSIRFTGSESAVAAAKEATLSWIKSREEARKEAEAAVTLRLRRDKVPAVIGPKGATIRSLRAEFECRVEVDSESATVSVRGGNAEKRALALEKIKFIISEDREMSLGDSAELDKPVSSDPSPEDQASPSLDFESDRATESSKPPLSPNSPRAVAVPHPQRVPQASDFPELLRPSEASFEGSKELADAEAAAGKVPEIMSSSTCSTAGSSKYEDDGEEEEPGLKWSDVVASRSTSEFVDGADAEA
jgi:rRNA processing protein Krr1/Pno1